MVFDRQFAIGLALRLLLLILLIAAFAWAVQTPGLDAATIVCAGLVLWAGYELWRFIQRTNFEVARFVEAIRFGDLSASFLRPKAGSGFDTLGASLDAAMRKLRDERSRLADESRFFQALADDLPVAILVVDADGRVETVGKTARRLFARAEGVRIQDFAPFGQGFAQCLRTLAPGKRQLVQLTLDGGAQRAMVRAAAIHRLGGALRVVTVQPIQEALNAVEVATQSDLIRVLTHEIMNSMTPVTSLARTAAELMGEIDAGADPRIADAHAAVETLARRADGVMHFVETYRQISRAPQIRRRAFAAAPFAEEIARLFRADREGLDFAHAVDPEALMIDADPDLLAQVLINLLRNAADAAEAHAERPRVVLRIGQAAGGGVRIEVEDNGPGVPDGIAGDIFLPFFTTKAKGTGVGLSLARQVILAHDGTIAIERGAEGGALFRIVL